MRKRILFRDEEISREIERRISEDRLKEGDKLPSERQLAEKFGVQRDTVRCALSILIKKGVLIKVPRQGYFVASKRIEINLSNFRTIRREVESSYVVEEHVPGLSCEELEERSLWKM